MIWVLCIGVGRFKCEELNQLKSRGFRASSLSTYDFSTLYTTYFPIAVPSIVQGHYLGSALFITEYCYFRTVMSQRLH